MYLVSLFDSQHQLNAGGLVSFFIFENSAIYAYQVAASFPLGTHKLQVSFQNVIIHLTHTLVVCSICDGNEAPSITVL